MTSRPHAIEEIVGPCGPAVSVRLPSAEATIELEGALVSSWIPRGHRDVLWAEPHPAGSDDATDGAGPAITGGIPLIGPWFGRGVNGSRSPAHGWLRTIPWSVVDASTTNDDRAVLRWEPAEADPTGAGVMATLSVEIGPTLAVALTITAGEEPLTLESALHTYLCVADIRDVTVRGLDGARYLDNTAGLAPRVQHGDLTPRGPVDGVYEIDAPVEIMDGDRVIRIVPGGSTRTVVWNPWGDGAAARSDMGDDAWTRFLCVETAACKDGHVHLEPGASHTISATFSVETI